MTDEHDPIHCERCQARIPLRAHCSPDGYAYCSAECLQLEEGLLECDCGELYHEEDECCGVCVRRSA